jgi:deazaflavin-dependent oxidoreductase (nitroreductase family)
MHAMAAPYWIARFNRRVTNRVLGPLALRLPGFGIVTHTGRTTGRVYRTPIMMFAHPGGYVVALTYGPRSDWVRNVLAHNGCTLRTRSLDLRLIRPRLLHDTQRRCVPPPVRLPLAILRVDDFLDLTLADETAPSGNPHSAG